MSNPTYQRPTYHTRELALAKIEQLGNQAKAQTQLGYWSAEDNARRIPEAERNLAQLRLVWTAIHQDRPDAAEVLRTACTTIGGIEGNFLRLVGIDLFKTDFYNRSER